MPLPPDAIAEIVKQVADVLNSNPDYSATREMIEDAKLSDMVKSMRLYCRKCKNLSAMQMAQRFRNLKLDERKRLLRKAIELGLVQVIVEGRAHRYFAPDTPMEKTKKQDNTASEKDTLIRRLIALAEDCERIEMTEVYEVCDKLRALIN